MSLDLLGFLAQAVFILVMLAAFFVSRGGLNTPPRRLNLAVRFYCAALVAQAVALVVNVADVSDDGWAMVGLSVFNLVCVAGILVLTRLRRVRNAEADR